MRQGCATDAESPFCELDFPEVFDGIPFDALDVTIVGGADRLATMEATIAQWDLPQVLPGLKALLFINDDENGAGRLVASHLSDGWHPLLELPGLELNAIDWYGYWKPTEAALDYAFDAGSGEAVLGGGDEARFMGLWSDGSPVAPMSTADDFR
jgi:hypothetical protein